MKNLISIFIILCSFSSLAQPPAAGTVNPNPDLDKFEGIWYGNDGNGKELTVKLKKIMYYTAGNDGYYKDVLVGCHKYTENGIVIEDNLSIFPILGQNQTGSIYLYGLRGNTPEYVIGTFWDSTRNKYERHSLEYHTATIPFFKWELRDRKEISIYRAGQPSYDFSVTLPEEIYLYKQ